MPGLPSQLGNLLSPRAYPHAVGNVEVLETARSWVLMAGEFAYLIGNPPAAGDPEFLGSRRRRCDDESRLGRRYAPELSPATVQIVARDGAAHVDGPGSPIDFAVRLRGYDPRQVLDRLLQVRAIEPHELAALGRDLAVIHAQAPAAAHGSAPWTDWTDVRSRFARTVGRALGDTPLPGLRSRLRDVGDALHERLGHAAPWIHSRREAGSVRECHGELLAEHVVRVGARFVAVNALREALQDRWTDVAAEIGSLTSDLTGRGRPLHAQELRDGYLAESGDYSLCRVLPLHEAGHCVARAGRLAALPHLQPDEAARHAECSRLLQGAMTVLQPPVPCVVLVCGAATPGARWLTRLVAGRLGGVRLEANEYGPVAPGRPQIAPAVEHVLAGGYTAVVDAGRSQRAQRAVLLARAREAGTRAYLVECRGRASALAGAHRAEPVRDDELAEIIRVDALDPQAPDSIARRIRR
jgi:aminoglycoside phosphotransferase family enzyme/predicted kinase